MAARINAITGNAVFFMAILLVKSAVNEPARLS
jgi:hypothetical protein